MERHPPYWIVDFHCDTLSAAMDHKGLYRRPQGHVDVMRLAQAGVDIQAFAVFTRPGATQSYLHQALRMVQLFWQEVEAGHLKPILWREDLEHPPPIPGGLISLEGAEPIGGDLGLLQLLFRLGVRAMGLTWNHRNALADGVAEAASGGGLTSFGRQVVAEMSRLGMLVDVSHLSEAGFWDVAACSLEPFVASHSNARAVCDHPRNLTDDQLRAIADCGGVIGINLYPPFLTSEPRASHVDVLRHAEHMLSVVGAAHVGLGCDFDGIQSTPDGLAGVQDLPRLRDWLVREFGEPVTARIMGGNFAGLLERTLPSQFVSPIDCVLGRHP